MFNYKDSECSVCKKPLKESDDIVVCPECGAPYHRECYAKEGACVHEAQHAGGFVYKQDKHSTDKPDMQCPNCNAKNSSENIFCESCGKPLHAGTAIQNKAAVTDSMPPPSYMGMPIVNPSEEIDGVPATEWAEYIGNSAPYYLYQFKNMDIQHRKTSICWSAVLFAPLYFTYRKVWSWCAVSWAVFIAAQIPSMLFLMEKLESPYAMGIDQNFLINLNNVASLLLTLTEIAFGLFGIYLYRKSVGKHLRKMHAKATSNEEFHQKLTKSKGPSVIAVVAAVLAFSAIMYMVMNSLLGPDSINAFINSYMNMTV